MGTAEEEGKEKDFRVASKLNSPALRTKEESVARGGAG